MVEDQSGKDRNRTEKEENNLSSPLCSNGSTAPPSHRDFIDVETFRPSSKAGIELTGVIIRVFPSYVVLFSPLRNAHLILVPRRLFRKPDSVVSDDSLAAGQWLYVREARTILPSDDNPGNSLTHVAVTSPTPSHVLTSVPGFNCIIFRGHVMCWVECSLYKKDNVELVVDQHRGEFYMITTEFGFEVIVPKNRIDHMFPSATELTADCTIRFWSQYCPPVCGVPLRLLDYECLEVEDLEGANYTLSFLDTEIQHIREASRKSASSHSYKSN